MPVSDEGARNEAIQDECMSVIEDLIKLYYKRIMILWNSVWKHSGAISDPSNAIIQGSQIHE